MEKKGFLENSGPDFLLNSYLPDLTNNGETKEAFVVGRKKLNIP